MKRKLLLLTLIAVAILVFAGCSCRHEWMDATCTEAKSCRLCGQRKGSAPGHSWSDPVCGTAKTCTVCGQTEGAPLEHDWRDATCTNAATCSRCGISEGTALGHDWQDATCTAPQTCSRCSATEGSANGHSWKNATCTEAKTCNICAVTEGTANGHSWTKATCLEPQTCLACGIQGSPAPGHSWVEATCEEPIHCPYCDTIQGEPLGHRWVEATPEAPKTCITCNKTEGYPIYIDDRFITADCEPLFGSWSYKLVYTAEDLNTPGFEGEIVEVITYTFGEYGTLVISNHVADVEAYKAMMSAQMSADIYAALAEDGMDAAAAEAFWLQQHNQTIAEFVASMVADITEQDLNVQEDGIYFVADGLLHTAQFWEDDTTAMTFTVEGDQLTIADELTGETIVLTRVVPVTEPNTCIPETPVI